MCGISEVTICAYERGTRRPRPEVAKRIEAATNGAVTAAELLGLPTTKGLREEPTPFEAEPATITISAPGAMVQEAERLGLDATALLTEGGVSGLRAAIKSAFVEKNQAGIDWSRDYVRTHGTIAEQFGMMPRETE